MNDRARQLGLRDTSYANPIGLDDEANYSSAHDLATLTRRLLRDKRFASIVARPSAKLSTGARQREIGNRNKLVGRMPFVDGVKTGHTLDAGHVLVGSATRDGARVVSVVLGEPSTTARDADTTALLRYGLDQFRRETVAAKGKTYARVKVRYRDERAPLVAARTVKASLLAGATTRMRVRAPEEIKGPLAAGKPVGRLEVVAGGRVVGSTTLVTKQAVPGAGVVRRTVSGLGVPLTLIARRRDPLVRGGLGTSL